MGTISFSMTYCAKAYEQRKQRRIEYKEQKNESDNNEEHEEHNKVVNEEREKYEWECDKRLLSMIILFLANCTNKKFYELFCLVGIKYILL